MPLHEVTWTHTESFTAVVDIPDGEVPTDWLDGDEGQEVLDELSEPNARDAAGHRVFYENHGHEIDSVSRQGNDELVAG